MDTKTTEWATEEQWLAICDAFHKQNGKLAYELMGAAIHQSRTELMRKVVGRLKERILGDMVDVIENGEQAGNNADLDKMFRYIHTALIKLAEEEKIDLTQPPLAG